MPTYTCRTCRQKFDAPDDPDAACIFCGAGLSEFQPRPDSHAGQYDLAAVAMGQRWLIRIAPLALLGQASFLLLSAIWIADWRIGVAELLPTILLAVVAGIQSYNTGSTMGRQIVSALAMFVPVVNIVLILDFFLTAKTILQRAGLKVGVLGISSEIARAANDPTRCLNCGYIITGIKSRRCPECGTPFSDR